MDKVEVNNQVSPFGSDGCKVAASGPQPTEESAYAEVPNMKAAATEAAMDALNQAKGAIMDKAQELKAKIVADLQARARQMLDDCANGRGPLAVLQAGCKLLRNGVSIDANGLSNAYVQNLNIGSDFSTPTISGTIDLSSWFSTTIPAFDFVLSVSKGAKGKSMVELPSISLMFTFDGGLTLTAAGILRAALPSGFGMGAIMDQAINSLGLNQISLTLDVIGININPFGVRVSGSCNLFGMSLNFNIMVGRFKGKFGVAMNFQIPGSLINVAVSKILGPAAKALTLFSVRSLDFSLATTNMDLSNTPVLAFDPDETEISKGFQLVMKAQFDPSVGNPFVKMLAKFLPGVWQVKVLFDGNKFTLKLSTSKMYLNAKRSIDLTCSVFVSGSIKPPKFSLGVEGILHVVVAGDVVTFTAMAKITLTNPSLGLSLSMIGRWPSPFGIPKLTVSDLVGEISVMAMAPWFNSMTLGGTITIGGCTDDRIIGKMYFRIDVVDVGGCYFYGSVNRLVVGQFMSIIFGVNNLPKLIAESGFPRGLLLSYAMQDGHTAAGDFIPMGYHFKGGANFMGIGVDVMEVIVSPIRMLYHIEFLPFTVGPIKFCRSKTDCRKGPIGHLEAKMKPFGFNCKIAAYIDLFLFKVVADIEVGATSMKFMVSTTLFGWLTASVSVTASYGTIRDAAFAFNAVIKTEEVKASTIQSINGFKQSCVAALDRKIADLNREEAKAKAAIDGMCNAQKGCGLNCNVRLLEEAGITWITEKDTDLFTVSMEEWEHLQTYVEIEQTANLSEKQLEEQGILVEMAEGVEVAGMVVHKCCRWIKKLAKKVVKGVTKVAKGVAKVATKVVKTVVTVAKKTVSTVINAACKGVNFVCSAGCVAGKFVGKLAVTGAYAVAKGAVELGKIILSGVLSAIVSILQNFAIHMEIGGSMNMENWAFNARFMMRMGSFSVDFSVSVNFRVSSITDLAIRCFQKVKDWLYARVKDLGKLF